MSNNVVFEHINEKYVYGVCGNIRIIIMKSNNYINVTKLCGNNNIIFGNWLKRLLNDELINEIKKEIKPIMIIKFGNIDSITGTYIHPSLISHIAGWISPVFAIKAWNC